MEFQHSLQFLSALWPFRNRPDSRSEDQIDDDLDAEFAFHLEQSTRELAHEGLAAAIAREKAHQKFGNL